MKNNFEIRGDVTAVFCTYQGEQKEVLIDTEDLPVMKEFDGTWAISYNRKGGHLYARMPIRVDGKNTHIKLHRIISNAPKGLVVDHINHDTLDNRKSNLRVLENWQNLMNQKRFTGVGWYKPYKKWRARGKLHGKEYSLGYHENYDDAVKAVEEFYEQNLKGIRVI